MLEYSFVFIDQKCFVLLVKVRLFGAKSCFYMSNIIILEKYYKQQKQQKIHFVHVTARGTIVSKDYGPQKFRIESKQPHRNEINLDWSISKLYESPDGPPIIPRIGHPVLEASSTQLIKAVVPSHTSFAVINPTSDLLVIVHVRCTKAHIAFGMVVLMAQLLQRTPTSKRNTTREPTRNRQRVRSSLSCYLPQRTNRHWTGQTDIQT